MQKVCANSWCKQSFEITDDDLTFYEKISPIFCGKKELIPPPTLCPECRLQLRMNWRPELHLFKRKSDRSGKVILSFLPQEAPATVYSPEEWWADDWSPYDYARSYDASKSFFEQFQALLQVTPIVSLSIGGENLNSDFLNSASWLKNCYLLAGANYDEDCLYGNFVNHCKDSVDCSFIDHCELCYECIDCTGCYNLRYSQQCSHCSSSSFLFACRNCKDCFGCVNLADKQYMFMNEQLSKDEYQKRLASVNLQSRSTVEQTQGYFRQHCLQYPHRYMIGEMNDNVSGNGILRSKNVHQSFDVSDAEDCKYCSWFHKVKDCYDCYAWGFTAEECYSCLEVGGGSSRVLFGTLMYTSSDCLYSVNCRSCSNLFGCVSLKKGSYCVLNKQYTKDEYERLVERIIERMRSEGEWGEPFPPSVCPMAYNQSIANDYFPIDEERAKEMRVRWSPEDAGEILDAPIEPPDTLDDADDVLCSTIYRCGDTRKSWKIIPQEVVFYRRLGIPPPARSPFARHLRRLRQRNPRKLWKRTCDKCQKPIATSYSPDRPEIVYCEECYLKEVY